ncbi:hypothetical protein CMQ_2587 [Grosmannia clavigera kw1407]|uniref:Uncharacterized protein n=1 Tax=Grosmannia clavigera (strain kw1407 / UAMH 11150) TaxID=655863 RepID=F0XH36_GROCL|nr:uncharacterized protein CMQ_2587 [Grosmannia clavigera kw1407]EFX02658.1 hypothetical protein CMQ_2587 [Grosmannia clavigera kw1407]
MTPIDTEPTRARSMEVQKAEVVALQVPISKQPTAEPRPTAKIENNDVYLRGGRMDVGCSFCHNTCTFRKGCC